MAKLTIPKSDYQKELEKVREKLPTSIIEVELITTPKGFKNIMQSREHARIIRNTILSSIEKRLEQLLRTKKYRMLQKRYFEVSTKIENTTDNKKKKTLTKKKTVISKEMTKMQKEYNVTYKSLEDEQKILRRKYSKAHSVISQKMAERAWQSIEERLYHGAKKSKYIGKEYFRSIEGKQNERAIMLKQDNKGKFFISYMDERYNLLVKKNDLFVEETLAAISNYFKNGADIEIENIEKIKLDFSLESTYRVKYNRIVFKEIRGNIRLFVQIVLEGEPKPKRNKDGTFRHTYGVGRIGNDIGNQSVAIVSEEHVELKNLAERTSKTRERKIVLLQHALDRSRRDNNPGSFDSKGRAIKKMENKSKKYIEKQKKLRNIHRIMAENRKYAHHEDINKQRAMGDVLITESGNYKALQKRAKETTVNEKTGKINRKKRAGKSILNRSPGYYHSWAKYRFESTGGKVQEVNNWTFKASQYDHKLNECNKKQLSQRKHTFEDGTTVQRDLYSGFLLFCSDNEYKKPDKELCDEKYNKFKNLHDECIEKIKQAGKEVKNSGIKICKSILKRKISFQEKKRNHRFSTLNKSRKVNKDLLTI